MPIKVDLEQRSDDWLKWRAKGIGGTAVDTIMGSNPFQSIEDLFKEKTGQIKNTFKMSPKMALGVKLEPAARAHFELLEDSDFPDACFMDDKDSFMRVSLDGWRESTKTVLELKCGESANKKALSGKIPEYYIGQCQYQLYVTKANDLLFCTFWGNRGTKPIILEPDLKYHREMVERVCAFHYRVQEFLKKQGVLA